MKLLNLLAGELHSPEQHFAMIPETTIKSLQLHTFFLHNGLYSRDPALQQAYSTLMSRKIMLSTFSNSMLPHLCL